MAGDKYGVDMAAFLLATMIIVAMPAIILGVIVGVAYNPWIGGAIVILGVPLGMLYMLPVITEGTRRMKKNDSTIKRTAIICLLLALLFSPSILTGVIMGRAHGATWGWSVGSVFAFIEWLILRPVFRSPDERK